LARRNREDTDSGAERRQMWLKTGGLLLVAVLFLAFAVRGRAQRQDTAAAAHESTPAAVAGSDGAGYGHTPAPTALPLPEITSVDDSLKTIGGLGGALTIGRPGSIEIRYGRTEETIALAIDPSKPTPRGELRYNEATMRSGNPVAVWLFGTVLNYAVGIPDSMVRNLEPGDRITLSTDTGATLRFVVAERRQGANHEAGQLLSQNRIGLTLFALPAAAAVDVSLAFAHYDVSYEENQAQAVYEVGEKFPLLGGSEMEVTAARFSHAPDGSIRIVVQGTRHAEVSSSNTLLSLTSNQEQTTAVILDSGDDGAWQAEFTLPADSAGRSLWAEFRAVPGGGLATVRLGDIPRLHEQLLLEISEAWWEGEYERAVLRVTVHNPGEGAVYLDRDFLQIHDEGGEAYNHFLGQVTPRLPFLIQPGETTGMVFTLSFLPESALVQIQIGADLWQIDLPAENGPSLEGGSARESHLATGRQP
jgi:hypothetical protein